MWLCECLCAGDGLLNDQLTLWRFDVSRQKREWVWGSESVGWPRLTTWFGAHWDTASCSVVIFYYWVVPYTVDIKLVEQLSLKKVRRCACGITLCSLSHLIELVSFPAKPKTEGTFQKWLNMLLKNARIIEFFPNRTVICLLLFLSALPTSSQKTDQNCKFKNAIEEELFLKLPHWQEGEQEG